jgi:hypothetical protein
VERETEKRTERIIERQPSARPQPRPTQRETTPPPDSDGDVTDVVPKVDLPEPVGKATEDVKKIADDALDGTIPLIP